MPNMITLILSLCLAAASSMASTTVWASGPDGLVARWNFDERTTIDGKGNVARDSSGNGHDAQLHGPVWVKHGKGFAISLDGLDDYVDCGSSTDLGLGGPLSLEAWVKSTRKAHGESKLLGEQYSSYVMTYYNGERVYWYIGGGGNNVRWKLSLNQWYHVIATFDGKMMRLWVNGRQVANKESDFKSLEPVGDFHIGTKGGPKSPKFKGMMDRVRIYDRALSDDEALEHFEAEKNEYLDLTWAGRVRVTPYYYTDRQEAVVEADYLGLQPLQGRGRLQVTLTSKEKPAEILQERKIDEVPGRTGLAEVALPCKHLAAGDYLVRVTLEDDHGAYPTEGFAFSCPLASRPLKSPVQAVAPPLLPKRPPTPFQLQMSEGGGFTITVKSEKYPFESRVSWPHGTLSSKQFPITFEEIRLAW